MYNVSKCWSSVDCFAAGLGRGRTVFLQRVSIRVDVASARKGSIFWGSFAPASLESFSIKIVKETLTPLSCYIRGKETRRKPFANT